LIIDVMEIDVRQQRADDSALWRSFLRLDQAPVLEHACCQPLGDQPDNPSVANPMLDEAGQPIPADLVEGRGATLPITEMFQPR
jgi:hypothetical protein